ncbi:MAG: hypothetical protein ACFE7E_04045 [Candidatus Hodarchaeota archaeon]
MEEPACPICGSKNVERWTDEVSTDDQILLNYHCNDCGEDFEWF